MMAEHLLGKPKDLYLSSYFVARRFVIEKILEYENPYPICGAGIKNNWKYWKCVCTT